MTRRPPNARDRAATVSMRGDPPTRCVQANVIGSGVPCVGTSGARLLSTMSSSSGHCLPLRHCPATHLVSLVLGNGPVLKLIGPTIDL